MVYYLKFSMQDSFDKKDARSCEACGLDLPYKMSKKTKGLTPNGQLLCKTCARVSIVYLAFFF
jgi:hypothetical protein